MHMQVQRKQNPQLSLEKRDMCFSPSGESIFGYTTEEDERLGCECSRKHWELTTAMADGDFDNAEEVGGRDKDQF